MLIREHPLLSQRDDGDADPPDLAGEVDTASASDELIADVFDHLGKTVADERGWDSDDGS